MKETEKKQRMRQEEILGVMSRSKQVRKKVVNYALCQGRKIKEDKKRKVTDRIGKLKVLGNSDKGFQFPTETKKWDTLCHLLGKPVLSLWNRAAHFS